MKRYLLILSAVFFLVAYTSISLCNAADYPADRKIDELADVSAAMTTSTRVPVQDMNDTDKLGAATIQQVITKVLGAAYDTAVELAALFAAKAPIAAPDFTGGITTQDSTPRFWACKALTGGTSGSLDNIPIASINDGDTAVVILTDTTYLYEFHSAATDAESSPGKIRPDDYATSGVWYQAGFGGINTLDIGNTDTTISRVSAGVIAVEGVTLPRIIASGSVAFDPASVNDGACSAAADGGSATGVLTTDRIVWNPSADPTGTTGYDPSGDLGFIWAYPTADHVNFKFCNKSGSAIDAGSITLNWMVLR